MFKDDYSCKNNFHVNNFMPVPRNMYCLTAWLLRHSRYTIQLHWSGPAEAATRESICTGDRWLAVCAGEHDGWPVLASDLCSCFLSHHGSSTAPTSTIQPRLRQRTTHHLPTRRTARRLDSSSSNGAATSMRPPRTRFIIRICIPVAPIVSRHMFTMRNRIGDALEQHIRLTRVSRTTQACRAATIP